METHSALQPRVWLLAKGVGADAGPAGGQPVERCFCSATASVSMSAGKAQSCGVLDFFKENLGICHLHGGLPASRAKFLAILGCLNFPFFVVFLNKSWEVPLVACLLHPESLSHASLPWKGKRGGERSERANCKLVFSGPLVFSPSEHAQSTGSIASQSAVDREGCDLSFFLRARCDGASLETPREGPGSERQAGRGSGLGAGALPWQPPAPRSFQREFYDPLASRPLFGPRPDYF